MASCLERQFDVCRILPRWIERFKDLRRVLCLLHNILISFGVGFSSFLLFWFHFHFYCVFFRLSFRCCCLSSVRVWEWLIFTRCIISPVLAGHGLETADRIVNPAVESRQPCVDARQICPSASNSKTDDAYLEPLAFFFADEWATSISLKLHTNARL